jgi:hypothetical protein
VKIGNVYVQGAVTVEEDGFVFIRCSQNSHLALGNRRIP